MCCWQSASLSGELALKKPTNWIVGQIAFFLCECLSWCPVLETKRLTPFPVAAGIQMGNTVIASYIVDSYPLQSMSVITFYSVFLNLSAFANPVIFHFSWLRKTIARLILKLSLVLHCFMGSTLRIHLDFCSSGYHHLLCIRSNLCSITSLGRFIENPGRAAKLDEF